MAPERDWPGHPGRRSLQPSQPTGLLGNDTPRGGYLFLTADPEPGVSKKEKSNQESQVPGGAVSRSGLLKCMK